MTARTAPARPTASARSWSSTSPTCDAWWPRRLRRAAAVRRRASTLDSRRRRALDDAGAAASASARCDWTPPPDEHGTAFTLRRQRPAGLRQGRQLDPRRRLPHAGSPRDRLRPPARPGRRGRTSTCSGCGAAASTSPTTSTTSATSAACWSGRTSCSPAPPTPRRSRCAAEVEAEARDNVTRLMPHPASLCCWNGGNENLWGYEDWGWKERARRQDLGRGLLPRAASRRSSPSSTRRARTAPGSPCVRPSWRAPPERPGPRHAPLWDVWNRARLPRLPRLPSRGSCPSSAGRGRRPGRTLRRASASPTTR